MSVPYKLYKGDCLEIMPTLEGVGVVITDPPYVGLVGGTTITIDGDAKRRNNSVTIGDEWSASLDWMDTAWELCKFGMIVFCSHRSVDIVKQKFPENAVSLATWHKRNAAPTVRNVPILTTEFIWYFKKESGMFWRKLFTMYDIPTLSSGFTATERVTNKDGSTFHPTQKPVLLMKKLLLSVPENAVVLDPFMGTGTTGVACAEMRIPFIGIERDPKYYSIAEKRIKQAAQQPALFHVAQQSVQRTGGESGQQNLFSAGEVLPAKVTRQSTRR